MSRPMLLLRNIGRLFTSRQDGVLERMAVACEADRISWLGPDADIPTTFAGAEEVDCGGALVTPGLVDAHTHPLYAGDRLAEIAARSEGATYLEIAELGGGIASTVRATRAAEESALAEAAADRLSTWLDCGATTVEAKTGYHLDEGGETAAVRILAGLASSRRTDAGTLPRIEVTFLGAHAVGPEWAGDRAGYAHEVARWCAGAAEAGARHCDVFCDEGYFSVEETRAILAAGSEAGLLPRLHADELARTGGARLAADIGAASADHLLRIDEGDARALAAAGVVATLAPTTALSMGHPPPARALLDAGATIALGTDHNPGTCGTTSMSLIVGLAVTSLGLSVSEALLGATSGGAAALRLPDRGRVAPGLLADLAVWEADHEGGFAWGFGLRPACVILGGVRVR
ncbi:MAG TPA: imidazolonepropionase [Acidimicrobiales bacterium]|nr:imidazolonepropionase [Acidimicrobiales bacterium]